MLGELETVLAVVNSERAGVRLRGITGLLPLLEFGSPIGNLAATQLGPAAKPVRAILFDKTPGTNWALSWHQDRTIAVRDRADLPGWGPWTRKAGILHVQPPFECIERMVTLRVHLDHVPPDNAPLLIAPGSHLFGRVPEADTGELVGRCGTAMCTADRGDVWMYATAIVHASAASTGHAHRRVLQVDYAAEPLPPPLEWLGI